MDRIDRRGFLECMAWTGTAIVWTAAGGVLSSRLAAPASAAEAPTGAFSFVQISDTHVGFKGQANSDAAATLQQVIDRVNALQPRPAFVLHTGDQTHGQKAGAFDTVAELLKGVKTERVFYVPGEHDVFLDGGKEYLSRYGKGTVDGRGWQSFDYKGTHFVGLVNVLKYKGEGMGSLGQEQIEWLEKDVGGLSSSTPIVVFSHVPLWAVYPQWGWTTEDAERALGYLRRFGSVTVLNGHIHQVVQKVHRVPAAGPRQRSRSGADEDPRGGGAADDRGHRGRVRAGQAPFGGGRLDARLGLGPHDPLEHDARRRRCPRAR